MLKLIIENPKSIFYEDQFLIKQWIKIQKNRREKKNG